MCNNPYKKNNIYAPHFSLGVTIPIEFSMHANNNCNLCGAISQEHDRETMNWVEWIMRLYYTASFSQDWLYMDRFTIREQNGTLWWQAHFSCLATLHGVLKD